MFFLTSHRPGRATILKMDVEVVRTHEVKVKLTFRYKNGTAAKEPGWVDLSQRAFTLLPRYPVRHVDHEDDKIISCYGLSRRLC
jgi:hypothetical protein